MPSRKTMLPARIQFRLPVKIRYFFLKSRKGGSKKRSIYENM